MQDVRSLLSIAIHKSAEFSLAGEASSVPSLLFVALVEAVQGIWEISLGENYSTRNRRLVSFPVISRKGIFLIQPEGTPPFVIPNTIRFNRTTQAGDLEVTIYQFQVM